MKRVLHTFISLCLFSTLVTAQAIQNLVINEFVASNDSVGGYQEPDGGFGDWVEFYNKGNTTINLEGINFSDDLTELDKWTFPTGTSLAADGYLIVWVDNDLDQNGIHAPFKLARIGEDLVLSQGGVIIDQYTYTEQQTNIAEARVPNGTGNFVMQTPTPNANNQTLSTRAPAALRLSVFPNPTTETLTLNTGQNRFDRYEVIDLKGAVVMKGALEIGSGELLLDVTALASGQYQLILDSGKAAASFTRR